MKNSKRLSFILCTFIGSFFITSSIINAGVIDDFEDGVIDTDLWSVRAGNYGGGTGSGEVNEGSGQLILHSFDNANTGGGFAGALLRKSILDTKISFTFDLTLYDDDFSDQYIPKLHFWVVGRDTYTGDPGPDGIDEIIYLMPHDQVNHTNHIIGHYYFYCDSTLEEIRLYDAVDDTLLGSASFPNFDLFPPHVCFRASCDTGTDGGDIQTTFKLEEIQRAEETVSVHEFSDGTTSKEIEFLFPGTQMVYLKLRKDSQITDASFSASGKEDLWNFNGKIRYLEIEDNLLGASGITTDSSTRIWVLNATNDRVYEYDLDFNLLNDWALKSDHNNPIGIEFINGYLWIGDDYNDIVYRYSPSGVYTNHYFSVITDGKHIRDLTTSPYSGYIYVLLEDEIKEYGYYSGVLKQRIDLSGMTDVVPCDGITSDTDRMVIYVSKFSSSTVYGFDIRSFFTVGGTITLDMSYQTGSWSLHPSNGLFFNLETKYGYKSFLTVESNYDNMCEYSNVYPTINPSLEVGTGDGIPEWSFSGEFETTDSVGNFTSQINEYLLTSDPDQNGYCLVPLAFSSDSEGVILIDNLNIEYLNTTNLLNHYDKNNRLVGEEFNSGFSIGYEYDGNGNLARKIRLQEDENTDGVPDILQFINGVSWTEPMDKSLDNDGDGWTDWQELLAGSNLYDYASQPGTWDDADSTDHSVASSNNYNGEVLSFTDEFGNPQDAIQLDFKPDRYVMATGNLDGILGDEIVIGADGDTGGHENFIWILSEQAEGWKSQKISIGDSAVTSIEIGDPNNSGNAAYIGLRNPVSMGTVLQVTYGSGSYVSQTLLTSNSQDTHVFGIRNGKSVVVCCDIEGDSQYNIYQLSPTNNWQPELEKAYQSSTMAGVIGSKQFGINSSSSSIINLKDPNSLEIQDLIEDESFEDGLVAYFPFSNNPHDYSSNQFTSFVTGTSYVEGHLRQANEAIHFSGSDLLEVKDVEEISFDSASDDYTISFWIDANDVTDGTLVYDIYGTGKAFEGYSYKIYLDANGYLHAASWDQVTDLDLISSVPITPGDWHNVVFVVRNQIARLYINGQLEDYDKACKYGTKTTGGLQVGQNFTGSIDDLRIYDRGLYKSEIQYLYDGTLASLEVPFGDSNILIKGNPFALSTLGDFAEEEVFFFDPNTYWVSLNGNPSPDPNWIDDGYTQIQDAINVAYDGDTIIVDDGSYNPITIDTSVIIKSLNDRDNCIIDALSSGRCVTMNVSAEIHEITIQNGKLTAADLDGDGYVRGGGVYIEKGGYLEDCIIQDCQLYIHQSTGFVAYGGGIYCRSGTIFKGCVISNNLIDGYTSASSAYSKSMNGGGVATSGRLMNCNILGNIVKGTGSGAASSHGAAVMGSAFMNSCIIANNSATADCGVLNSASGGIYGCIANNCVFSNNYTHCGNASQQASSKAYGCAPSSTTINCLFVKNTSSAQTFSCSVAFKATMNNCILYKNSSPGIVARQNDNSFLNNCLIMNTSLYYYKGEGEIILNDCFQDEDPGFVSFIDDTDYTNDDYHLDRDSVCIDTGHNDYISENTDLDGNTRIAWGTVDIGVYEYGSKIPLNNEGSTGDTPRLLNIVSIRDTDSSGHINAGDTFDFSSYQLGDIEYPLIQKNSVPINSNNINQSYAFCNVEMDNELKLFTAEPDGQIFLWPVSINNETIQIDRELFSSQYKSMSWQAISGTQTIYDTHLLTGLFVDPNDMKNAKLALWSLKDSNPPEDIPDSNEYQSTPTVEITSGANTGGAITSITATVSDMEYNTCEITLQYRLLPNGNWQSGTINAINGQSYVDNPSVSTTPDGHEIQILWDALSDLGSGFNGSVEIRVVADDVSQSSQPDTIQYTINTDDRTGIPQVDITNAPDSVGYLTDVVGIAGTSVNASGNIILKNLRNDHSCSVAAQANWQVSNIPLEQGDNVIVVYARNSQGFTVSDSVTIYRGRYNMPGVQIDPISGPVKGKVSFTGSCNEYVAQLEVSNITSGDTVEVTPSATWQTPLLNMAVGENVIRATAYSAGGESNTDEITVMAENATWYVDDDSSGGDGLSWDEALYELQDALTSALAGDTIYVAEGVYKPDHGYNQILGDRHTTFQLINGIHIYGGFSYDGSWDNRDPNQFPTILSGDLSGDDGTNFENYGDNSFHIVTCQDVNDIIIDGFTITSGYCNGSVSGGVDQEGAGIYCENVSNITVQNCRIVKHRGIGHTAAEIVDSEDMTLINTIFSDNNTLSENGAGTVRLNRTSGVIANCIFNNNTAKYDLALTIWDNSPLITNCLFYDNYGGRGSAPLDIRNNAHSAVNNCTFYNNNGAQAGSVVVNHGAQITVKNCIMQSNNGKPAMYVYPNRDCTIDATYSNVEGGYSGIGNIDVDPLFADPNTNDCHLKSQAGRWNPYSLSWIYDTETSPCIDAGDPNDENWKNELWPHGKRVNMGAYGGTPEASMSNNDLAGILGDINNDGIVNFKDFCYIANEWSSCQGSCTETVVINTELHKLGDNPGVYPDVYGWPAPEGTQWQETFQIPALLSSDATLHLHVANIDLSDKIYVNEHLVGTLNYTGGGTSWQDQYKSVSKEMLLEGTNVIRLESVLSDGGNYDDFVFDNITLEYEPLLEHYLSKADLDLDGSIGVNDLMIFAENWLSEESLDMTWMYINDDGSGMKDENGNPISHGGFTGYMSKYETTNAQYREYLKSAMNDGLITVYENVVYATSDTSHSQPYFDTFAASSHSQIIYSGGEFHVRTRDGYDMSDHPVVCVSWYGATAFCNYYGYRLPTEWEWQAVADHDGEFNYGCGVNIDQSRANYNGANPLGLSNPYTSPAGYYPSYGYEICDMAGNVWEWTNSCYYSDCSGGDHVLRGGTWSSPASNCTVSNRSHLSPDYMSNSIGFRVCR